MRVAVIGSGMAGLTSAAVLANAGHQVTVFEQYPRAGGVTAPLEQDGFRWDLGQLLVEGFGPDEPVGKILDELGVLKRIRVRKDDRTYIFPGFGLQKPSTYSGPLWRIDRLKELFPAETRNLDRYWADYVRFTRVMTCARRMEGARGLTRLVWQVLLYANLLPFLPRKDWSAQRLMDSYFQDERLKAVFISILADFFTPPSQFIGLGVFALNPEPSFDCRIPKDIAKTAEQLYHYSVLEGIGTLVDALVDQIIQNNGHVLTGKPVSKIVIEKNKVKGLVCEDGEFHPADAILASGGAKETFCHLVGKELLPAEFVERVEKLPLMDSVFMVHLGIDMDPAPHVPGVCSYCYGTFEIENGIRQAKEGIYHEGKDGFVVHIPTHHSPEMAPAGFHSITIYTICPDLLKDADWEECKEIYADTLVAYAEEYIPGLRQHTRVRVILTPQDFRSRTHTAHHAFGGIAPVLGAARIPHQTPVEGLWFIGAQSESGGGINNVIPAAYRTAMRLVNPVKRN